MIDLNDKIINQYFWYYDNLNSSNTLENKLIIPILKIEKMCYVFSNNNKCIFDDKIQLNFKKYNEKFKFAAIDDSCNISDVTDFILLFVKIDNYQWIITNNDMLIGNNLCYELLMKNTKSIKFNFEKVNKTSNNKIKNNNNNKLNVIETEINSGIDEPVFDDFVVISINDADI